MAKTSRRRLPEEDIERAVAEIINSPITKANLSFLTAPPEPKPAPVIALPLGDSGQGGGVGPEPTGVDHAPGGPGPKPTGTDRAAEPPGGPKPAAAHLEPRSERPLWQAEQIDVVFEQSRVRRIERAQDALSLVEERVYNLLWGQRNTKRDEFRLIHASLQRITNETQLNIKTVRELMPRLVEKGFIEIEAPADPRRNTPTLYRVWSYSGVLARQRERNRFFVVKTGKGVFYAHPVTAALSPTVPMGFEPTPAGVKPTGGAGNSVGAEPHAGGLKPMDPMAPGPSKPMGAAGALSIGIQVQEPSRQTTTPAYGPLIQAIRGILGVEPDTALLDAMIAECRERAIETTGEPATGEELLYFLRSKARVLASSPNIRNPLAVLRRALPECFAGEAFRVFRSAARKQPEPTLEPVDSGERLAEQELWSRISEKHRTASGYDMQAIAADPELNDKGRRIANQMQRNLGRFTRNGLVV